MKLQNLLFVRSCVPDRVQPVERRNARTQKIEVHFLLFGSDGALKSALHMNGCANSEKHYRKQNTNHHSVIYRTMMVVCGKVVVFTALLASPPNGKVDGVLLRTVLHGRNPERFSRSNKDLLYRAACMLHGKTIL